MTTKVSFNPDTFLEGGGGLLDDVDVKIDSVLFDRDCTYGGRITDPVFAFVVNMTIQNPSEEHTEDPSHVEYYSAGSRDFFAIEADGHGLTPLGSSTALRKSCKASQFFTSLVNAGFPADKLDESIGTIEGLLCHLSQKPVPKGSFGGTHDDQGRPKTILLCDTVNLDGTQVAGDSAAASTGKVPAGSDPTAMIMGILAKAGKPLEIPDLYQLMFAELKDDPNRNNVIKAVGAGDNKFLKDGPWTFDGTSIKV